jgi:hypothetical protein
VHGDDALIGAGDPPAPVDLGHEERVAACSREFEIKRTIGQAALDFKAVLEHLASFDFHMARDRAVKGLMDVKRGEREIFKGAPR